MSAEAGGCGCLPIAGAMSEHSCKYPALVAECNTWQMSFEEKAELYAEAAEERDTLIVEKRALVERERRLREALERLIGHADMRNWYANSTFSRVIDEAKKLLKEG